MAASIRSHAWRVPSTVAKESREVAGPRAGVIGEDLVDRRPKFGHRDPATDVLSGAELGVAASVPELVEQDRHDDRRLPGRENKGVHAVRAGVYDRTHVGEDGPDGHERPNSGTVGQSGGDRLVRREVQAALVPMQTSTGGSPA